MNRKFIIDTNTASDDAVALIMAGNVNLEQGMRNCQIIFY